MADVNKLSSYFHCLISHNQKSSIDSEVANVDVLIKNKSVVSVNVDVFTYGRLAWCRLGGTPILEVSDLAVLTCAGSLRNSLPAYGLAPLSQISIHGKVGAIISGAEEFAHSCIYLYVLEWLDGSTLAAQAKRHILVYCDIISEDMSQISALASIDIDSGQRSSCSGRFSKIRNGGSVTLEDSSVSEAHIIDLSLLEIVEPENDGFFGGGILAGLNCNVGPVDFSSPPDIVDFTSYIWHTPRISFVLRVLDAVRESVED